MILESAILLNKLWEKFRELPYQDGGGVWMIGYGFTHYPNDEEVKEDDPPMSEARALQLLRDGLLERASALHTSFIGWRDLLPYQKTALLSFAHNTGYVFGDGKHDTLDKALLTNLLDVPDALMLYVNKGTTDEPGLTRRRYSEGLVWMGHNPVEAYNIASVWEPTIECNLPQADEMTPQKSEEPVVPAPKSKRATRERVDM